MYTKDQITSAIWEELKEAKHTGDNNDRVYEVIGIVTTALERIKPSGLPLSEPILTDEDVRDWEGEKKMNDADAIEWDSIRMVGRVKERFKELEEKQHDWRSFYIGWLEGRVDMLQQIKGWGRLSQEQADFIREANNRDLEGTAAGREEDAVAFAEWLDITRNSNNEIWKDMRIWGKEDAFKLVYELFKQQKEKQ